MKVNLDTEHQIALELKALCQKWNIVSLICEFRLSFEEHFVSDERGFTYKAASQNYGVESSLLTALTRTSEGL